MLRETSTRWEERREDASKFSLARFNWLFCISLWQIVVSPRATSALCFIKNYLNTRPLAILLCWCVIGHIAGFRVGELLFGAIVSELLNRVWKE